jgi:hypothetical protein
MPHTYLQVHHVLDVIPGPFRPDAASCCTTSLGLWEGLLHTPHIRMPNGRKGGARLGESGLRYIWTRTSIGSHLPVYLLSSVQSSFTPLFAMQQRQRQRQRFKIHNVIPSTSPSTMEGFTETHITTSCFNIGA